MSSSRRLGTSVRAVMNESVGRARTPWWRDAVVYQVSLRSFADGTDDGVGDVAGLRSRLPYLSELGVDAVWVNPWYRSPQVDGGYDVAGYCAVDPRFGSLAVAEELIVAPTRTGVPAVW